MRRWTGFLLAAVLALGVAACTAEPSATPSPSATVAPTATPTVPPTSTATEEPESSTPTPEPALSLDLPDSTDPRVITATVTPDIGAEGGTLTVVVANMADERIDEIVMRWSAELESVLRLAPFAPSDGRINDTAPPLSAQQAWTKWVIGPGEQGEPDGTISIGWGPLLSGASLTIPLVVTRLADGPVGFDFQFLSGNDLLNLEGGEPAELRIEVP